MFHPLCLFILLDRLGSHCAAESTPCTESPHLPVPPCALAAQGAGWSSRLGVRAQLVSGILKKYLSKGNWCGRRKKIQHSSTLKYI